MVVQKRKRRSVLNTSINDSVLKAYKETCKEIGCPMNIPLEAFMSQFSDGEFSLKLGRDCAMVDLTDDDADIDAEAS